jgi:hypothetical protein
MRRSSAGGSYTLKLKKVKSYPLFGIARINPKLLGGRLMDFDRIL